MIKNLKFSYRKGTLITFEKDGVREIIPYSAIKSIWRNLTIDSIEGWRCRVFDNLVAFTILVAQGQGVVLFVWDIDKKEMIHYSEASYCIDFMITGSKVITMYEVTNFVTPYHIQLYVCDFGTKDIFDAGHRIYCQTPVSYDQDKSFDDDMYLKVRNNELYIVVGKSEFLYSDDVQYIESQQPNPEFSYLYKVWDDQFDPGKHAMRGMIT